VNSFISFIISYDPREQGALSVCTPAYAGFQLTPELGFRNNFRERSCLGMAGGHMGIKTKYGWQELYATALLETDWSKIGEKIQVAENGIKARLHEFSMNHGGTPEEDQAIEDSLNGLDTPRKEVATWQESKRES